MFLAQIIELSRLLECSSRFDLIDRLTLRPFKAELPTVKSNGHIFATRGTFTIFYFQLTR
jgi:hypothetical protein